MEGIASATFEVQSWDEEPFDEYEDGRKLTVAVVTKTFKGDIVGESDLRYLMSYDDEGEGTFVGIERIVGRLGDRAGSFVLQHSGTYQEGTASGTLIVIPGAGTGELASLRGQGGFSLKHEQVYGFTLQYEYD